MRRRRRPLGRPLARIIHSLAGCGRNQLRRRVRSLWIHRKTFEPQPSAGMQGSATSRANLCHTEMPGPHGQVSGVDSTRPRPRAPLSAKHTRTGQSSARSSTYSYSTHTKYACIHAVRAYSSAGSSTHTLAERPITAGKRERACDSTEWGQTGHCPSGTRLPFGNFVGESKRGDSSTECGQCPSGYSSALW